MMDEDELEEGEMGPEQQANKVELNFNVGVDV